jgi:hypothetical protein
LYDATECHTGINEQSLCHPILRDALADARIAHHAERMRCARRQSIQTITDGRRMPRTGTYATRRGRSHEVAPENRRTAASPDVDEKDDWYAVQESNLRPGD